jgi:hypothetical protein
VSAVEKRSAAWLQLSVRRKKTKQQDYRKALLGCTDFGPMAGCWRLFKLAYTQIVGSSLGFFFI